MWPASRWNLLFSLVLVIDSTSAFVAPLTTTTSPHYDARQRTFSSSSSSSPSLYYSKDALPLENYKNTATALLDLLEQANQMVESIQILTSHLETCKTIDPDIDDHGHDNNDDTASSSSLSSSMSTSRLDQAMQRALEATDTHGRFSQQAEQAWFYVTTHALERNHPSAPYLSHPSYRYGYARSLLLQRQQRHDNPPTKRYDDDDTQQQQPASVEQRVVAQTQQVSTALSDMEKTLRSEISRLQDRELARMALLKSLSK